MLARQRKVLANACKWDRSAGRHPRKKVETASQPLSARPKRVRAQSHVVLARRPFARQCGGGKDVTRPWRCRLPRCITQMLVLQRMNCCPCTPIAPITIALYLSHLLTQHPTRRPSLSHFALRGSVGGLDTPLCSASCTPYYPPSPTLPQPKHLTNTVAAMDYVANTTTTHSFSCPESAQPEI